MAARRAPVNYGDPYGLQPERCPEGYRWALYQDEAGTEFYCARQLETVTVTGRRSNWGFSANFGNPNARGGYAYAKVGTIPEARSGGPGAFGAILDFGFTYAEMRRANTKFSDRYFHAKANCEAAQRGAGGVRMAQIISNTREFFDQHWPKYDPAWASALDQQANVFGRRAGMASPGGSCSDLVVDFRPNGLSPQY